MIDVTDDRQSGANYILRLMPCEEKSRDDKEHEGGRNCKGSSLSYASPLVIVTKKEGSNRICVDDRKSNLVFVTVPAPMAAAEDLF